MHIDANKVEVAFPQKDGALKVVVGGVTLRVKKGEFLTLMGPSGSGKTVLMKSIYGAQRITRGVVRVGSEMVRRANRHRGMVYQTYSLYPHLTVLENIALGPILEHTGLPTRLAYSPVNILEEVGLRALLDRASILDRIPVWRGFRGVRRSALAQASEFLKRIGLTEADGKKFPHELSGGMRQRVAIAQALMMKPDVLFMDEAFGALDPIVRREMQQWLLELWNEFGLTIFFVTHDEEEGLYLATRFIALSQYWTHNDGSPGVGAKIVYDIEVPDALAQSGDWRESDEFRRILAEMRRHAMDKTHCQRLSECVLTHPDAVPHQ